MRLAFRDFAVDDWTPGAMDVEAARLLREIFPRYVGKPGLPEATRKKRLVKRTQIVFCAALLSHTARQMRSKRIERFVDLPERNRDKARKQAEKTLARIAMGEITPDHIIQED